MARSGVEPSVAQLRSKSWMVRRISGTRGLRRLLPAVLLAASLAAPTTLAAQAAGEDAAGQGAASSPAAAPDPGVSSDPSPPAATETTPTAPEPSSPVAPAPAQPKTDSTTRAKSSASTSVSIVDFAFDPGATTVHAGDTVQWTNLGTAKEGHSASSAEFDSGILQTGGTYSFTFRQPGTFSYVCSTHPDMKGSVRVLAASTGSGNSQGSGKKKPGGSGSTGGGSGSSSSDASGSAPAPTGSGSESAAVSSPDAAGSNSSLPSTGSDSLLLAIIGLLLLDLGLALRLARSVGLVRPRR